MIRRNFLKVTFLSLFAYLFINLINRYNRIDIWKVIEVVQNHLYPNSEQYKGASELNCINYLKDTMNNKYFNINDKIFIIEGAQKLEKQYNFLAKSEKQREEILKEYANEQFGGVWIEVLIGYTLEGVFSDPIYDGNQNELGWKSFNYLPGYLRPKSKYGKNS